MVKTLLPPGFCNYVPQSCPLPTVQMWAILRGILQWDEWGLQTSRSMIIALWHGIDTTLYILTMPSKWTRIPHIALRPGFFTKPVVMVYTIKLFSKRRSCHSCVYLTLHVPLQLPQRRLRKRILRKENYAKKGSHINSLSLSKQTT